MCWLWGQFNWESSEWGGGGVKGSLAKGCCLHGEALNPKASNQRALKTQRKSQFKVEGYRKDRAGEAKGWKTPGSTFFLTNLNPEGWLKRTDKHKGESLLLKVPDIPIELKFIPLRLNFNIPLLLAPLPNSKPSLLQSTAPEITSTWI